MTAAPQDRNDSSARTTATTPCKTGIFISFEGIDGAGKSTHIKTLADALVQAGHVVVQTREPGGTPLAEQLRELVLHQRMSARTEALLLFAARSDHLEQRIVPALQAGKTVLCDRFTDASYAYQGGALDWRELAQLEQLVQRPGQINPGSARPAASLTLLQPDLTLWFDLAPALAAQRLSQARTPDKFEQQSTAFFAAVRKRYARRARQAPQRFVHLDASAPLPAVEAAVFAAVRQRGWL